VSQLFVFDKSYPKKRRWQEVYDANASNTSILVNENFSATTGGATVTGKTFQDQVEWSPDNENWTQNFGSVTKMENFGDGQFTYDGVMGLGWDPYGLKTAGPDAPPIVNIFKLWNWNPEGKGYTLMFSDTITRINFIPLGGAITVPLVANAAGIPVFNLDGFAVADYEDAFETPAVVDSGYSVIALPAAQFRRLYALIQPDFDPESGLYTVDCGVPQPTLEFKLGGKSQNVPQKRYVLDINDMDGCIVAIAKSVEPEPIFHLGIPFLLSADVSFDIDHDKIGVTSKE